MDHVIVIDEQGTVRTLYTDKIDLRDFGTPRVERASNVEWDNKRGGWIVMFPNNGYDPIGPRYLAQLNGGAIYPSFDARYAVVFDTREAALAAEVDFLQARL